MAGSYGYRFIFFSVIFYLFLGFLMTLGAGSWLAGVSTQGTNFTMGNYTLNQTEMTPTTWDYASYIFQNPFSNSGLTWLLWLSLGILITDIYIIVTSVIP